MFRMVNSSQGLEPAAAASWLVWHRCAAQCSRSREALYALCILSRRVNVFFCFDAAAIPAEERRVAYVFFTLGLVFKNE